MTSSQWRHSYCITEKYHQTNVTRFFILGPTQSKFLAMPVEPIRTFFGQGGRRGQFFAILWGRLLWRPPLGLCNY